MAKTSLWVVVGNVTDAAFIATAPIEGWLTDEDGGCLFVSREQAERAARNMDLSIGRVQPCPLDDDLAQMCKLYRH